MTKQAPVVGEEYLNCIVCTDRYPVNEARYLCDCGGPLSVERPLELLKSVNPVLFDQRLLSRKDCDVSGVWRFREAILNLNPSEIVTHPEGQTRLYQRTALSQWAGVDELYLKHEGENPTGSFKDRGMTVAVSQAKRLGAQVVACASTGNTSSSLAAYAAQADLKAVVFLPAGKVALGKMAQAIAYGSQCLMIQGSFDDAMAVVRELGHDERIYLVNSLNPFRLEGQKSIIWEILQNLNWSVPDWIVVPGGNLGNTSAFGKAIHEAYEAGWINKKPRLATIQAKGANPFAQAFQDKFESMSPVVPETVATAIRIGNPVNYEKAKRVIQSLDGVVAEVDDQAILAAKALIDRQGIGCEPASACSLAGVKKLVAEGVIKSNESVVGILTGHILKDPDVILQGKKDLWQETDIDVERIKSLIF
ncbi:MAG: threonine synthase [Oligoflexus sp.]